MTQLVSEALRERYSVAKLKDVAPAPSQIAGSRHLNGHQTKNLKPQPKSSPTMTPAQVRWLKENQKFEIVTVGKNYDQLGVVTPNGGFFGGVFPVLQHGYLRVGVLQLTARERATARERRRLAQMDPEARQRRRERESELQRQRRARKRQDPAERKKVAEQRREEWRRKMTDPIAAEKERQRSRERARLRQAARKAAKLSVRDTGAVALKQRSGMTLETAKGQSGALPRVG
jgi:hypothetical protein